MSLKTIRLELARSPEAPEGNKNHGYVFVAPLDAEDHIDAAAWQRNRDRCTVRRFSEVEDDMHGRLVRGDGRRWAFHYDGQGQPDEEEPGYKFDSHAFRLGEYVSITEHDGVMRTFKVVAADPVE